MKKGRFIGFIIGCISVVVGLCIVWFTDSGLIFLISVVLGTGGILLISWGSMYFKRNYPDTTKGIKTIIRIGEKGLKEITDKNSELKKRTKKLENATKAD